MQVYQPRGRVLDVIGGLPPLSFNSASPIARSGFIVTARMRNSPTLRTAQTCSLPFRSQTTERDSD